MNIIAETQHFPNHIGSSACEKTQLADLSVDKLFELEAAKAPERVAIVCGDETLTYGELNLRANRIAHFLLSSGLEREAFVGILMQRSPDMIAAMLGILKAGGAYLPLDPEYPMERLAMMVAEAKASILLTDAVYQNDFSFEGTANICVDSIEDDPKYHDDPQTIVSPDSLAYVMFTSGSTGVPKGVMIEHRSIIGLVKDESYADFGPENVFLHFAPVTFDASTFEIWGALLNGAKISIMPEGRTSLADLGNVIRKDGVTTMWLTAGLFHVMIDERIDDLKPLRQLLAGGDVLSVSHLRKALDNLDCDLINGYGPTENTTFTCCYKVPRNTELGHAIPIGKPVAGSHLFFLDENLEPVAEGEIGEIYIGGEGLSRGYLNQPELTSERFIANPFPGVSSERLYRSGDLGRLLPDGNVEFLGRADNQIKIRGYRIELEEIESALEKQDAVRGAIAVVKGGSTDDKQLFAFVVTDPQAAVDRDELKREIAKTLPAYMVPSRIISVGSFPLNSNGKVDRKALVGMVEEARSSLASPTNDTEQTIARTLCEVLGVNAVDVNDNFFDLGASSLQIARLHHRLAAIFGSELKILFLYQYPTVRALAKSLDKQDTNAAMTPALQTRALRQRAAYASQRSFNPRRK